MYHYILSPLLFAPAFFAKQCTDLYVPISISARNGVFNVAPLKANLDATTFIQNVTSTAGNFTQTALTRYTTVSGTYNISARFCKPDQPLSPNPTIQLLVHGIGFDKTYWDIPFQAPTYSYTTVAVDHHCFCTLAIDRLGVGSSFPQGSDPLQEIQEPLERAALYAVTQKLRAGTILGVSVNFDKVVHVGHSFGSIQIFNMVAQHPGASDGLVLTGFSRKGDWLSQTFAAWDSKLARLSQPFRFGNADPTLVRGSLGAAQLETKLDIYGTVALLTKGLGLTPAQILELIRSAQLQGFSNGLLENALAIRQNLPSGYLTWADEGANQYTFFKPGGFDSKILDFAETHKQPFTLGEVLTVASQIAIPENFTGPVFVLNGDEDSIFCGGDCTSSSTSAPKGISAAVAQAFPKVKSFQNLVLPNVGHGINLHYNAPVGFEAIQVFLKKQRLGSS